MMFNVTNLVVVIFIIYSLFSLFQSKNGWQIDFSVMVILASAGDFRYLLICCLGNIIEDSQCRLGISSRSVLILTRDK